MTPAAQRTQCLSTGAAGLHLPVDKRTSGFVALHNAGMPPSQLRFLTLADVAELLNISASQAYALVRNGELPAIKIGGRGQWRVEQQMLERYIAQMYQQTHEFVVEHPFSQTDAYSQS